MRVRDARFTPILSFSPKIHRKRNEMFTLVNRDLYLFYSPAISWIIDSRTDRRRLQDVVHRKLCFGNVSLVD